MIGRRYPCTNFKYNEVSSVMFVRPEIASVGINEQQAQNFGIEYKVGSIRLL